MPSYEGDAEKGIWIWKNHHSLADGISCMSMTLQLDDTYDISKLIKFPKITWVTRAFLKVMLPISFLQTVWKIINLKQDRNYLNDGQRNSLTGKKLLSFGEPLSFK